MSVAIATSSTKETYQGDPSVSHEVSHLLLDALSTIEDDRTTALELIERASVLLGPSISTLPASRETEDHTASSPQVDIVKGGLAPWQMRRVAELVDSRIEECLRIEELASAVKLSVSYFSAAFKTSFRQPPHAYVTAQRVSKAKQQIAYTDLPLCEVALNCGLADQAHLSRIFRRYTGCTPSQWRRMHSSATESAR